ncbi:hypothetical protein BDW71DRAFT_180231 [Aspergillus fruticulosus]
MRADLEGLGREHVRLGFKSSIPTFSVNREEREKILGDAWHKSSGFHFIFGTFCDISYKEDANRELSSFIKRKIPSEPRGLFRTSGLRVVHYVVRVIMKSSTSRTWILSM